jgi:hypothetical protein
VRVGGHAGEEAATPLTPAAVQEVKRVHLLQKGEIRLPEGFVVIVQ